MSADERIRAAERRGDWCQVVVEAIRSGLIDREGLERIRSVAYGEIANLNTADERVKRRAEGAASAKVLAEMGHVLPGSVVRGWGFGGQLLTFRSSPGGKPHAVRADLTSICGRVRVAPESLLSTLYWDTYVICAACKSTPRGWRSYEGKDRLGILGLRVVDDVEQPA